MYFLQKLRSNQVVRIKQLIIISLRDSIALSLHGCVVMIWQPASIILLTNYFRDGGCYLLIYLLLLSGQGVSLDLPIPLPPPWLGWLLDSFTVLLP